MGTLFSQSERDHCTVTRNDLEDFLEEALRLSQKHKVNVTDVIAAKHALELRRRNDLLVRNGDAWDEQIAGIGELLQGLVAATEDLKGE